MELPPLLRQGVDAALAGVSLADLGRAAGTLSARYRAEIRDGRFHLSDDIAARAYLATRLPATYAAIRAAMAAVADIRPHFTPVDLLDLGSGPGSAFWAAMDCWPDLGHALLVEGSGIIRTWGERLAQDAPVPSEWRAGNVTEPLADLQPRDLVTLAYVLDELDEPARGPLVDRLWSLTRDTLLIVEPGTPAGWERILAARGRLIAAGATLLAPCPHAAACPLVRPDWCHFSRRVARSRLHRQAKGAEVPWEDEKFIYLAASRLPGQQPAARVIAPPRLGSGQVRLKLCLSEGRAEERLFTKRSGADFKRARRSDWGDAL
ncbi:small ribosomal subunit Rsm22 family protein [Microvirga rosea]|uniref:small ribosomal subunit Rsm22 family protein n=1 Tax=Microvirga rosea TaxID=2715425 RepID=UPI001D0AC8F7|nr:small ribosomal subunit Rsm22 family protein [Microvirga rosea]MCB8819106.1 methyltransferase type 11 [Microvirga rosea]